MQSVQSEKKTRHRRTIFPRIWLMAADSLSVHSLMTSPLFSFMNSMKAFNGFLTWGFLSFCCGAIIPATTNNKKKQKEKKTITFTLKCWLMSCFVLKTEAHSHSCTRLLSRCFSWTFEDPWCKLSRVLPSGAPGEQPLHSPLTCNNIFTILC